MSSELTRTRTRIVCNALLTTHLVVDTISLTPRDKSLESEIILSLLFVTCFFPHFLQKFRTCEGAATQSNASIIDARQPRVNHALTLRVATQGHVNF